LILSLTYSHFPTDVSFPLKSVYDFSQFIVLFIVCFFCPSPNQPTWHLSVCLLAV